MDSESIEIIDGIAQLTGKAASEIIRGSVRNLKNNIPDFILEQNPKKKPSYESKFNPYKRKMSRLVYFGDLAQDLDSYKAITGKSKSKLLQMLLREYRDNNPHEFTKPQSD